MAGKRMLAALLTTCALIPGVARAASEEAGRGAGELGTVVLLVVVIGVAYVLAHNVVERLQRRFLVVSGAEYLLLGVLLGYPAVGVFDDVTGLLPIIALAAGWVGLLRGTDFDFTSLQKLDPATWRIVFLHHLLPGAAVGVGSYYFFTVGLPHLEIVLGLASEADGVRMLGETETRTAMLSSAALACFAAADSAEPFDLLSRRYEITGRLAPLLRNGTRLGDIMVILAFGLIFCFFHGGSAGSDGPDPSTWAWFTVLLGMALGFLFSLFLAGDESDNSRFLALVGIIAFASGGAYILDLSPLAVNLVMGFVLVNTARRGHLLHTTLESTERPMTIVLLIFAGALWTDTVLSAEKPPDAGVIVIALGGFLILRTFAKWFASVLAAWGTTLRRDIFRGLLAHGDVTLAMAVSFRLVYEGGAADIAYSVVLGSIIINDLIAPRLLRGLLADQGEIQREISESDSRTSIEVSAK